MNAIRQWLCSATDRQLLLTFTDMPTATLEAIAMAAYAVAAERSLYGRRPAPGIDAEAV